MPGNPGWSSLFAGATTAPWTSSIVYSAVALVRPSQGASIIGFQAVWGQGGTVVVEATTNLTSKSWLPVSTNILTTGTLLFTDAASPGIHHRLYRVRTQ